MSPPWADGWGFLDEEELAREGEGYIEEDDYDFSDESESSEIGSDDLTRGHAWPDPFDSGTEPSTSPPQSARSDPATPIPEDDLLPPIAGHPMPQLFIQQLGKSALQPQIPFEAHFVEYDPQQLPPPPQPHELPQPMAAQQLPSQQDPQSKWAAATTFAVDSGRSSSATSKGSQISDRRTVYAAGAAEGPRPAGQSKRHGGRACGRAQEQLRCKARGADECPKKESSEAQGAPAATERFAAAAASTAASSGYHRGA